MNVYKKIYYKNRVIKKLLIQNYGLHLSDRQGGGGGCLR